MLIGSILSIFAINAWVLPYKNFEPNEVAWTVSTLFLWYWCFPFILPRLQRLSNIQLAENIVRCYWISVCIGILLHIALGGFRNEVKEPLSSQSIICDLCKKSYSSSYIHQHIQSNYRHYHINYCQLSPTFNHTTQKLSLALNWSDLLNCSEL